jgi:hypothetical protein
MAHLDRHRPPKHFFTVTHHAHHIFISMQPTREQIDRCSIAAWYPQFRKHSIQTRLIPLPAAFVEYLNADGLAMPRGVAHTTRVNRDEKDEIDEGDCSETGESEEGEVGFAEMTAADREWLRQCQQTANRMEPTFDEADEVDDEDQHSDGDASIHEAAQSQYDFPELIAQIQSSIDELGGAVMPKLNWSAPKVLLSIFFWIRNLISLIMFFRSGCKLDCLQ